MPRVDDPGLDGETVLWRRVLPAWLIADADQEGGYRPGSWAFTDRHTREVSVFVAGLTDVEKVLDGYPDDSLVAIKAGVPRGAGGTVALTPENPDPAHRVICYENPSQMRRAAKLITDKNNFKWVRLKVPPPPS